MPTQQSPNSIDSKSLVLVYQDKNGKTFNKVLDNTSMVWYLHLTQDNSTIIYKTPIPVQYDRHEVYLCSCYNNVNLWTTTGEP